MSRSLAGLRPSTSMCRAPEAERNTGPVARTGPKKLRSMALNWTDKAKLVRFRDLYLARLVEVTPGWKPGPAARTRARGRSSGRIARLRERSGSRRAAGQTWPVTAPRRLAVEHRW